MPLAATTPAYMQPHGSTHSALHVRRVSLLLRPVHRLLATGGQGTNGRVSSRTRSAFGNGAELILGTCLTE
ncbi:hypothetical protein E2562_023599 [Oryza meyeriana var. granulata]|uniref:Uncharacterized protein n=1 Tax=Oryza meyeriana var. granulata TaxID=110450 RepID=A0A6G1FBD8_9ORYZ|nr:hypothetical protein E2562_023599 [Oryza meyeriana var. granulata]